MLRLRWILLVAVALALAAIACGGGAAVASNGPPITPVVALPPAWTPTVEPALTLPEGWKPLIGAGVELWLPGSFEGGDPATRREELIEVFRSLGPDYEDIVAALESGAPSLVFMAFDTGLAGAIVGITRHDLPASVGLAEYVEAFVAEQPSLTPGLVVLESGTMSLAGEDVGKAKLDITTQGATSTQVSYFFHRGDFVYTVSYAVPKEYFAEAEPAFEVSIASFRVTQ